MELARKLGVSTVPYLVMLLDGHPYHYTEASVSMVSSLGKKLFSIWRENKPSMKIIERVFISVLKLTHFSRKWFLILVLTVNPGR